MTEPSTTDAQEPQPRKRGSNAKRRRGARQKAMQALYQWDFDPTAGTPESIFQQFCEMQNMEKVDVEYFEGLFLYATENTSEIDAEISRHLDRRLDKLDPIERSVLRVCCVELKTELSTPYKVAVNEALEISKEFGADKGYRYINGIADKLAASLRQIEYTRDHPDGNPLSEQEIKAPKVRVQGNVKISMKEKADAPVADKPAVPSSPSARNTDESPYSKATESTKSDKKVVQPKPSSSNSTADQLASEKPVSEKPASEKGADPEQSEEESPETLPPGSPWATSPWAKSGSKSKPESDEADND